jgi:hypothetical protein
MDLKNILQTALVRAILKDDPKGDLGEVHRDRSWRWIHALATEFQSEYPLEGGFRVFWAGNVHNRSDFGLEEFLFDISVCEVSSVRSAQRGLDLLFIKNAVWQVESELEKDSKKAIQDFGKLVVGSAQNKLFIAPLVSKEKEFLRVLREPASHCSGSAYLAMIPHPREWKENEALTKLWKLVEAIWVEW